MSNANINALVLDPSLNVVPFIQSPRSAKIARASTKSRHGRSKNHTLVAVAEFNPSHTRHTGIGGFTLPSRAYETTGYERQFRLTETAVLNATAITETRLQIRSDRGEQKPETSAYALNVQEAFNGGGDQSGPSLNRRMFEAVYNNTTLTRGSHVLRLGARLRRVGVKDNHAQSFVAPIPLVVEMQLCSTQIIRWSQMPRAIHSSIRSQVLNVIDGRCCSSREVHQNL